MLVVNAQLTVEEETPGGTTVATTATAPDLGGGRSKVRVATDTAVYISFGTAPNAETDASRLYLPAGAVEYFDIAALSKAAVVAAA
jgi:hypothetical protein